jgi:hypothetical protein
MDSLAVYKCIGLFGPFLVHLKQIIAQIVICILQKKITSTKKKSQFPNPLVIIEAMVSTQETLKLAPSH